jgi:uncharacterized protein (UPF0333 family)
MRERGQVGLEYLVFTAFLLLMTALLFAYAYMNYSNTIQVVQTQAAVDSVASSVDFVYAKGPGNAVIVDIKLPVGLTEFRVDQNVVRATLTQYGSNTILYAFTKTPITPQYLYFQEGLYSLRVAMEDVNASVANT